jgi:hypothetical protein
MTHVPTNGQPRFSLGQVLATPGALEALEQSDQSPSEFLSRHASGDWGEELCDEDRQLNDDALADGSRLLSAYRLNNSTKIWIITEAENADRSRSCTTLLLPEEY